VYVHCCSGADAPRHDPRKCFYIEFLEIDAVRERGGSLNGIEVECGVRKVELRNGMCRKLLQSGAALKAIVRRESVRSDRRCTVCDHVEV